MQTTNITLALILAAAVSACGGPEVVQTRRPVEAMCTNTPADQPWTCGEALTAECGTPLTIWVDRNNVNDCSALHVDPSTALPPGEYEITVREGSQFVCSAELEVVDTTAPEVQANALEAWPPNHKMFEVEVSDCVTIQDACDPDVEAWFTYVSSSEPVDALGDGSTEPDMTITCDTVRVRAERSGTGEGRVYRIGVRTVDDDDHITDAECTVVVPHDQGQTPTVTSAPHNRIETAECAAAQ